MAKKHVWDTGKLAHNISGVRLSVNAFGVLLRSMHDDYEFEQDDEGTWRGRYIKSSDTQGFVVASPEGNMLCLQFYGTRWDYDDADLDGLAEMEKSRGNWAKVFRLPELGVLYKRLSKAYERGAEYSSEELKAMYEAAKPGKEGAKVLMVSKSDGVWEFLPPPPMVGMMFRRVRDKLLEAKAMTVPNHTSENETLGAMAHWRPEMITQFREWLGKHEVPDIAEAPRDPKRAENHGPSKTTQTPSYPKGFPKTKGKQKLWRKKADIMRDMDEEYRKECLDGDTEKARVQTFEYAERILQKTHDNKNSDSTLSRIRRARREGLI